MKTPALGQAVQYANALGEMRPGKVVGVRWLTGYGYPVVTVETPGGWNTEIPAHALTWDAPVALDRAELEILLDLAGITESDMRDGSLSGTSWDLEDIQTLIKKLKSIGHDAL